MGFKFGFSPAALYRARYLQTRRSSRLELVVGIAEVLILGLVLRRLVLVALVLELLVLTCGVCSRSANEPWPGGRPRQPKQRPQPRMMCRCSACRGGSQAEAGPRVPASIGPLRVPRAAAPVLPTSPKRPTQVCYPLYKAGTRGCCAPSRANHWPRPRAMARATQPHTRKADAAISTSPSSCAPPPPSSGPPPPSCRTSPSPCPYQRPRSSQQTGGRRRCRR